MAQRNQPRTRTTERTHEGGVAQAGSNEQQLRRAVTACLLWESTFYESGEDIATRIHGLANRCSADFVGDLALDVRKKHGLRHAPLWLILALLPRKDMPGVAKAKLITEVISRADEIAEVLAMYWDGKGEGKPVSAALKRGMAGAFHKFEEYHFGKYKGAGKAVTLRDAMFIAHPKPKDKDQADLFKRIADDTLKTPDTWEVGLSAGGDKQKVFTDLLNKGKLGYLACLRNIRNMVEANVNRELITERLEDPKGRGGILPFQFLTASLMVPGFESVLDAAMIASLEAMDVFPGKTAVMVDTSGSMETPISQRNTMAAVDAAAAMAIMARELCDDVRVYAWASECQEVPARRGMALRDAVRQMHVGHATFGDNAVEHVMKDGPWDRIIMITDMQLHDHLQGYPEVEHKYLVNVRTNQNGVGYGNWNWVDGFSAQTLRYMRELEAIE